MIILSILTTSLIYFSLKRLGERTFWTREWKGQPFHSWEWSISKFPCSPTRNITSHSMENLAFHSLLGWKMIILRILTTPSPHPVPPGHITFPNTSLYLRKSTCCWRSYSTVHRDHTTRDHFRPRAVRSRSGSQMCSWCHWQGRSRTSVDTCSRLWVSSRSYKTELIKIDKEGN